jgi:hypothetical protein
MFFQGFYLSANNYNKYFHKFYGQSKVQETMVSFVLPLMGLSSLMIVTTCSFQELVPIVATCTCENFLKTLIGTSTSLPVSRSYL